MVPAAAAWSERRIRAVTVGAVLAVAAAIWPPASLTATAQRPAAAPPCDLLNDAEVLARISGPGEAALRRACEDTPAGGESAPVGEASSGPNILVNDRSVDEYPNITQSEPSIGVSGDTALVGFNDSGEVFREGDFIGYARSENAGRTWADMGALPTPLGELANVLGDPVVAVDRDRSADESGVFYLSSIARSVSGRFVVGVHKSVDGGLGWVSAVDASPRGTAEEFQDKEWIAVDPRPSGPGAGNVYACWRRFGGAGGIQLSRSTDGGATFTQLPDNVSANPTFVQGCQVAVSPVTGHVYVSWTDENTDPPTIRLRRSTDRGATFEPERIVGSANFAETVIRCSESGHRRVFADDERAGRTRAIRSLPFSSLTVDPTRGDVYLAWHRAGLPGGAGADIAFSRSMDGGETFQSPVRINGESAGHQFFASVAANASGELVAIYYSTQNSSTDRLLDLYTVSSDDGGDSWDSPQRLTDVSFDRPRTNANFDYIVASCYMGDYNAVGTAPPSLGNDTIYAAWGDNRSDGNARMPGVQPDPDVRVDWAVP